MLHSMQPRGSTHRAGVQSRAIMRNSTVRWTAALFCLAVSCHYVFVILPPAAAESGSHVVPDLYPGWYATRVVLDGHDPYSSEVTHQIQSDLYHNRFAGRNEQRFAYPMFASVLLAPFAVMPFAAAQTCFLVIAVLLTALSIPAWLGKWGAWRSQMIVVILAFAAFPVMLGLSLRQPTMVVAALLAATYANLRSRHLVTAGILAAVSSTKPQLAVAVLAPMFCWALSDRCGRKYFAVSFLLSMLTLAGISEHLSHGWFPRWLLTIRAYAGYAGAKPFVCMLPGVYLPVLVAALLIAASAAVSWKWRTADLLLAVGFSASAFQLLFPFQFYNEVMLLPGVLWAILRSHRPIRFSQLLLRHSIWGILALGVVAMAVTCLAHFLCPPAVSRLWRLPLIVAWLFPFPLLAYLAVCASTPQMAGVSSIEIQFAQVHIREAPRA